MPMVELTKVLIEFAKKRQLSYDNPTKMKNAIRLERQKQNKDVHWDGTNSAKTDSLSLNDLEKLAGQLGDFPLAKKALALISQQRVYDQKKIEAEQKLQEAEGELSEVRKQRDEKPEKNPKTRVTPCASK